MKISAKELRRLKKLYAHEDKARHEGFQVIAGVDEAGRGPLAGPVAAAACIIPHGLWIAGVNDSKKLTPQKRLEIFQQITTNPNISYGIAMVDVLVIDEINIFQATKQAMLKAIDRLSIRPDILLVDGLKLPHPTIPERKIIGGDALSFLIAAASILAKVARDKLMNEYHELWPSYGFDQHKGYATEKHRQALAKYGPCPIHRKSFSCRLNLETAVSRFKDSP